MSQGIHITEADLRSFMHDQRYWNPGQPERKAFSDWVTQGWHSLDAVHGASKGGSVWVKAYDRTRDGHSEHVSAHWRGAPPGHAGSSGNSREADGEVAGHRAEGPNYRGMAAGATPPRRGWRRRRRRRRRKSWIQTATTSGRSCAGGAAHRSAGATTPGELAGASRQIWRIRRGQQREVDGGMPQMSADFHGLTGPRPVQNYPHGLMVGSTADGRKVVARGSNEGRATIELQRADGETLFKFRYGERAQ